MAGTACVLFDFDGPICDFKDHLRERGCLFDEILLEDDPYVIFWKSLFLWDQGQEAAFLELFELLEQRECIAAKTAKLTYLFDEFLGYLFEEDKKVAITTNNSRKAVEAFFKANFEKVPSELMENIYGRYDYNPYNLKPNPLCLKLAMDRLNVSSDECLMIGDSVSDYEAAKRAGVRFLGHTFTFSKAAPLLEAGAEVVISGYDHLLDALDVELNLKVIATE